MKHYGIRRYRAPFPSGVCLWAHGRHVAINIELRLPRGMWHGRSFRRIYNSTPGRWRWAWLAGCGPVVATVILT